MSKETEVKNEEVKVEDLKGFELAPDEVTVVMPLRIPNNGNPFMVTFKHKFSRLLNREERLERYEQSFLTRQVKNEATDIGDPASVINSAWDAMILGIEGYSVKGKKIKISDPLPDDLKAIIPLSHKVKGIHALESFSIDTATESIEEQLDEGVFELSNDTTIRATITQGDAEFPVEFILGELKALEIKNAVFKQSTKVLSDRSEVTRVTGLKKTVEFFDKKLKRVSGLLYRGADLMEQENWKDLIPVNYKLAAFLSVNAQFGEEVKN